MDKPVLWNLNWKSYDYFEENLLTEDSDRYSDVNLPHTVKGPPSSHFSHQETAMISTYVKLLSVTSRMLENKIILVFDGVMTYSELFVNGRRVGEYKGGYSKSMFDITGPCKEGPSRIVLRVDSYEREDIPPSGYAIDYMTYGGIYRDVWLCCCSQVSAECTLTRYDSENKNTILKSEPFLDNSGPECSLTADICLKDKEGTIMTFYKRYIQAAPDKSSITLEPQYVSSPILWDPGNPYFCTADITLEPGRRVLDRHHVRTGFRTVAYTPEGLFINNRKIRIMGLNHRQSFPYVGYAMGRRAQEKGADILKNYLNANTVRASHYMQSEHLPGRCDEIELLVFSKIPGRGHVGGGEFKKVMIQDMGSMTPTQYNHPGIFVWSIYINESLDDDQLYTRANALTHRLDSSRPTTSVRYTINSHLLEDVYPLNDFTYLDCNLDGIKLFKGRREVTGLEYLVPFMITELSGTALSIKFWDNAGRRTTHARAYARVYNHSNLLKDPLGIIGRCAFDYNTHAGYGSGDKICYYGVMDMFRIPKYAAYVLRSQKNPEQEIVVEPTTEFSRGDNKGNRLVSLPMALTNRDYIEVEMYGKPLVRYYPDNRYIGLEHPSVEIEEEIGVWQDLWQDGPITGYYKGKAVIQKKFFRDPSLHDMEVIAGGTKFYGDYTDATRVVCRVMDCVSTTPTYFSGIVQVETNGPIQVIGPPATLVRGGCAAFRVKINPQSFSGNAETAEAHIRLTDTPAEKKCVKIDVVESDMGVG